MRRFVDTAKAIRVSPELLQRCAALAEHIMDDPEMRLMVPRMSVSAVARVAMLVGIQTLERKYGVDS